MDGRKVRLIRGCRSAFSDGLVEAAGAHGHSQALDDALQLDGLAPEGVVSAVAPGRPHHLGPLVPHHRVGWRRKKKSHIRKSSFVVFFTRLFRGRGGNFGRSDPCRRSGQVTLKPHREVSC